jgi:alpha-beta hydrolase superfamily lysophospholipase
MEDGSGHDGTGGIVEATDGVELHYLRWTDTQARPWASVIFLHGIASHAGWFAETAAGLQAAGVAVYAPDRRGSGRSGGLRGHLDRYERALEDVDRVIELAASEHEGTPLFLAASSWAAKLAVVHLARQHPPLAGTMLVGPGLHPTVDLSPSKRLEVVGRHLFTPTTLLEIPLTPELYTTNPPHLEFIRTDPLRLLEVTAQFFWETGRLDRRRARASAALDPPLLVMQGEADAMMDVPRTRRWFARLPLEDKTYRAYPDAGHTLDFQDDPSEYRADMLAWLSAHAPRRRPQWSVVR